MLGSWNMIFWIHAKYPYNVVRLEHHVSAQNWVTISMKLNKEVNKSETQKTKKLIVYKSEETKRTAMNDITVKLSFT